MRKVLDDKVFERMGGDSVMRIASRGYYHIYGSSEVDWSTQHLRTRQRAKIVALGCYWLAQKLKERDSSDLDWSLKPLAMRIRQSRAYRDTTLQNNDEGLRSGMKRIVRTYKKDIGALPGYENYDPLKKALMPHRTKPVVDILIWLHKSDVLVDAKQRTLDDMSDPYKRSFQNFWADALAKLVTRKGLYNKTTVSRELIHKLECRGGDRYSYIRALDRKLTQRRLDRSKKLVESCN